MSDLIVDRLLKGIDVDSNLLPYLKLSGWEEEPEPNSHWVVLLGEPDATDQRLELVFPKNASREEKQPYIVKAINLLSELKSEPEQLLLQNILSYDRDMLYVKNTETDADSAISFRLAVNQINNLKSTIEFSACAENQVKPFYPSSTTAARKMLSSFLFGHTFAGSFGFTVEAPKLPTPPELRQISMFDDAPPPSYTPIERRVMERIARGLATAEAAEEQRNYSILVNDYASGFNSNMCLAIAGMSRDKRSTVEFRIVWSPKIKPGDDVEHLEPVRLRTDGYELLEFAAKQMKTLEPEFVQIRGNVRALTANENPQNLNAKRAVVVRGYYAGMQRTVDIIVESDREDYAEAHRAHIHWLTIEVSGIISRSGSVWRLTNVKNLQVIDQD